jgi:starch synthase
MNVLVAASEVVGFAKTGGLADVAGSLPRALEERGHHCVVFLPLYRCSREAQNPPEATDLTVTVPVGGRLVKGQLWRSSLPGSNVTVYLVEQPEYYDRDDPSQGQGLYQYTLTDGSKRDFSDNASRFIFFSRAVLEALPLINFWPEVLQANDWQTGLVPVYLREFYYTHADPNLQARYQNIGTLFTIHNIGYKGEFWHWDMILAGLDWRLFNHHQLEFYGNISFLKAGIVFSDLINTVSPTYAKEIQTPFFGTGLQGVLAERRHDLFGIVNGADYAIWNPVTDPFLEKCYDAATVAVGKSACKKALQKRLEILERPDIPLLGMVARLVDQKGLEILIPAARKILNQEVQLVVLGMGDQRYHDQLMDLRRHHPQQVGLFFGFDEPLAHQIEAGADAFLMPSQYEPSGLNQLYSMKYGTPPIVRATGGLADTVMDCTPETLAADKATGFCFGPYSVEEFLLAIQRCLDLYCHRPEDWLRMVRCGMSQDWSWERSAREYEKLYERLRRQMGKGIRGFE